jgi:hypothetical protein
MPRRRCPDDAGQHRIEKVVDRFRAVCACGWQSRFYESEGLAIDSWGVHRGRRVTDAEDEQQVS